MNNSDPHICARCHQTGWGCCLLGQSLVDHMFGLTVDEIQAISRASDLKPGQFMVKDEISPEFERTLKQIHPVFGQTMPRRQRHRLRIRRDGTCVFLRESGCSLPAASRPLYCKLYPFWFTPSGRLTVLLSDKCLAQQNAHSVAEMLARMGLAQAELKQLFLRLKTLAAKHMEWFEAGGSF